MSTRWNVTECVRLEVETFAAGVRNQFRDPHLELGTWEWVSPRNIDNATFSGLTYMSLATGPLVADGGPPTIRSMTFPASPGDKAAAQLTLRSGTKGLEAWLEWVDVAGSVLVATPAGAWSQHATDDMSYTRTPPDVAPAGTVGVRLAIRAWDTWQRLQSTPGGTVHVRDFRLGVSPPAVPIVLASLVTPAWTDITGPTTNMDIDRDGLSPGLLTAKVLDSTLDPITAPQLRPGAKVRVRAKVHQVPVTFDSVADTVNTTEPHGLQINDIVYFQTTGTLPVGNGSPLLKWRVVNPTATSFQVNGSMTYSEAAVQAFAGVQDNGAGTHTMQKGHPDQWTQLYEGTIQEGDVRYNLRETGVKRARISLRATNAVAKLANALRPDGVAEISQLAGVLEGVGVPWKLNFTGTQAGDDGHYVTPPRVSVIAGASALDQVAITRDSERGYAWVTARDYLAAGKTLVPNFVQGRLTEDVYSTLDAGFATGSIINEVTLKLIRTNPATGDSEEVTYGPFQDERSISAWGRRAAEFRVHGLADTAAAAKAYAEAVLTSSAPAGVFCDAVEIPVRSPEDVNADRVFLELYDRVLLTNRNGINLAQRVTAIRHKITPKGWRVELRFSRDGAAASPIGTTPAPQASTTLVPSGGLPVTAASGVTSSGTRVLPGVLNVNATVTTARVSGDVLFVIPEKTRPAAGTAIFGTLVSVSNGGNALIRVHVEANGNVTTQNALAVNDILRGSIPLTY